MRLLIVLSFIVLSVIVKAQPSNDTAYLRIAQMKDDTNKVNAFFDRAILSLVSDLELSGFLGMEAYKLAKKIRYESGIIRSCNLLSEFHKQKGDLRQAYEWLKKTIATREKNNDRFGLAVTYFQMTNIFRDLENYKMALQFAKKSLYYSRLMGQERFIALSETAVASVFEEIREYDSALIYYQNSVDRQLKLKDSSAAMSPMNNIAMIYTAQQEYKKAIEYSLKALWLGKTKGNPSYNLSCYENLAVAYLKSSDLINAGKMFDACFSIMDKFAGATQRLNIYYYYAQYLAQKGDYANAYKFNLEFQEMKDSIDKIDVKKSLNDLETKYQADKKEQENKLLRQKRKIDELTINEANRKGFLLTMILVCSVIVLLILGMFFVSRVKTARKLKAQNEQINKQNHTLKTLNTQLIENEEALQHSNEAKEQLLSIISHDISSPIRAIYNYETGVVANLEMMSFDEVKQVVIKLHQSTGNIYNLSNNLLDYAYTQQHGFIAEKKPVELKKLMEEVELHLRDKLNEKQILFKNNIPSDALPVSDYNLLRIIVRNLVSNSIKFSEIQKSIEVNWNEDIGAIKIADQGKGMDSETVQNILSGTHNHSQSGTWGEKGTGLGTKLVMNCTKILQARMSIDSKPGKGTSIDIILPSGE